MLPGDGLALPDRAASWPSRCTESVADLLNLEVDLLFFDTTIDLFRDRKTPMRTVPHGASAARRRLSQRRTPTRARRPGSATYGKSKDRRDDLPQIVIGMAVTREGIPVRLWCWPGNTSDSALIRQVNAEMRDWNLVKVIWVTDRGFSSARNRRFLKQGGDGYIIGEKLRSELRRW